ncbi:MAG: hypothetical protein KKD25_01660 [Gammaproteobacteria bacterium]|nr:hypothetical protein [Gammaproteobacteria bacterium]MBU0771754.1 hypothetical protein [Gammaproteobacteria bacterium]MBU0855510.1 hypothetical protein [Gammaproteobacteria bacterium]MBU1846072.1 hypothetical protein [Gammaproteobacteria bacterium]
MAERSNIDARICQRVAELTDRSSPEDWPEAMLVTADELIEIINSELEVATTVPAEVSMPLQCNWYQEDEGSDVWGTSCGSRFTLNDGTPFDNRMEHCAFCGKHIIDNPWPDDGGDEQKGGA